MCSSSIVGSLLCDSLREGKITKEEYLYHPRAYQQTPDPEYAYVEALSCVPHSNGLLVGAHALPNNLAWVGVPQAC